MALSLLVVAAVGRLPFPWLPGAKHRNKPTLLLFSLSSNYPLLGVGLSLDTMCSVPLGPRLADPFNIYHSLFFITTTFM